MKKYDNLKKEVDIQMYERHLEFLTKQIETLIDNVAYLEERIIDLIKMVENDNRNKQIR